MCREPFASLAAATCVPYRPVPRHPVHMCTYCCPLEPRRSCSSCSISVWGFSLCFLGSVVSCSLSLSLSFSLLSSSSAKPHSPPSISLQALLPRECSCSRRGGCSCSCITVTGVDFISNIAASPCRAADCLPRTPPPICAPASTDRLHGCCSFHPYPSRILFCGTPASMEMFYSPFFHRFTCLSLSLFLSLLLYAFSVSTRMFCLFLLLVYSSPRSIPLPANIWTLYT